MAKSKVISVRVSYEAYAEILMKCSKENTDISDFIKDAVLESGHKDETIWQLNSEIELQKTVIELHKTEISEFQEVIKSHELALTTGVSEIERLKKELEACKDATGTQIEKLKKAAEDDKAEIKRLTKLYNDLGTSTSKNIETLQNDLKNALQRVENANEYCVQNGIGTGIFAGNQVVQF